MVWKLVLLLFLTVIMNAWTDGTLWVNQWVAVKDEGDLAVCSYLPKFCCLWYHDMD